MPTSVERASRGASPIVLVLAALCFLLPFVGVSCDSSAIQGVAGSVPLGAAGGAATSACLSAISNTDLYSYSGLNLTTGSAPSTAGIPPSCSTTAGGSATASETPTVGVQPLLVVVLVLILVGIAATLARSPLRYAVGLGAALGAAILVIANNSVVHDAIRDRISALANMSSGSPNLGLAEVGGVGGFFNIHAAIGFTLVLVALFLAVAVNLAALLAGPVIRIVHAPPGAAPPPGPPPPPAPD